MKLNLTPQMAPGLVTMALGACLALIGPKLAHRADSAPTLKLIGAALAAVGAILVFIPEL